MPGLARLDVRPPRLSLATRPPRLKAKPMAGRLPVSCITLWCGG